MMSRLSGFSSLGNSSFFVTSPSSDQLRGNLQESPMESTDSSIGSHQPQLPPGFRFHPTDEELVVHYLKKKASSVPLPVTIIAEVNLYKFDPWELPAKATFGEQEWYFFSPRDRKYPNGARPNRAATSGYWKATGTDKPVLTSGGAQKVGVKKALVFYRGKPPKGIKTSWIMHEYRLVDNKPTTSCRPTGGYDTKRGGSLRLDDWVLCRIYKKNTPQRGMGEDREESTIGGPALLNSVTVGQQNPEFQQPKAGAHHFGAMSETQHNDNNNLFDGMMGGDATATYSASTSPSMQSLFPLKRTFPPSLYWNDGAAATATSSDNGSGVRGGEGSSSFTALLGQGPPFHQQETMLGGLGDGGLYRHTYQVPGMNWFS